MSLSIKFKGDGNSDVVISEGYALGKKHLWFSVRNNKTYRSTFIPIEKKQEIIDFLKKLRGVKK